MLLEKIQKENDIKNLEPEELKPLAEEIRQFLIEKDQPYRRTSCFQFRSCRAYNCTAPRLRISAG